MIVPANSFIATAEAVTLVGATPRFVDVDPATALVTAELVEPAIGPRTRCVIPVHLYGRTVDLDPIVELARGAGHRGDRGRLPGPRRLARLGAGPARSATAARSRSTPPRTSARGATRGGLVTNDDTIADRVRLLRSHGERPRYHHLVPGTTARLDAIQAAVLRVKLRRLDDVNAGRRRVAAALTDALAGAPVGPPGPVGRGGDHVFHQYVVGSDDRDELREHLERARASRSGDPLPGGDPPLGGLRVGRPRPGLAARRRVRWRAGSARCRCTRR